MRVASYGPMNCLKLLLIIGLIVGIQNPSLADKSCPEETSTSSLEDINSLMEEIELEQTESKITFSGVIDKRSINRLISRIDKAIEKNKGTQQKIILSLDSTGGDINETIRAVKYIRELNQDPLIEIHTKLLSNNNCESACTILFTAGEKRFAGERAKFGFHSPKFQRGDRNGMSKKEIEEIYRNVWFNYISQVDPSTADVLRSRGYLLHQWMSYLPARELSTGYVTDYF
jgi:ATP-dependent protease ClpP protease subunit